MTEKNKDQFELTFLARIRTELANERTLLAYIRTSLYFTVGGLALVNVEQLQEFTFIAAICFGISLLLLGIGIYRFVDLRNRLEEEGRRKL